MRQVSFDSVTWLRRFTSAATCRSREEIDDREQRSHCCLIDLCSLTSCHLLLLCMCLFLRANTGFNVFSEPSLTLPCVWPVHAVLRGTLAPARLPCSRWQCSCPCTWWSLLRNALAIPLADTDVGFSTYLNCQKGSKGLDLAINIMGRAWCNRAQPWGTAKGSAARGTQACATICRHLYETKGV